MTNNLSAMEQKEIFEVLGDLGLSDKEQSVYLALMKIGLNSLSPIARETKLPLTTVQAIVKKLEGRGLVKVAMQKSRHLYDAEDPSNLKKLLENQLTEIANIIPFLKKIKGEAGTSPKVTVYQGERVTKIFDLALNAKSKLVYEIVAAKDFQEMIGEKYHFTRRRVAKNIQLKSLRVENQEIKKYNAAIHARELREAKFLPRELTFTSSLSFWDDYLAIFSSADENIAVLIKSQSLVLMHQQVFELLWSVSRKMETI